MSAESHSSSPSNSRTVIRLTTPPTASDPYSADAPSFSTSSRSMAIMGASRLMFLMRVRLPLMSCSVPSLPRPRRLTGLSARSTQQLPPPRAVAIRLLFVMLPSVNGRVAVRSDKPEIPSESRSSAVIIDSGDAESKLERRTRVPVTTISSMVSSAAASAASSAAAVAAGTRNSAARTSPRNFMLCFIETPFSNTTVVMESSWRGRAMSSCAMGHARVPVRGPRRGRHGDAERGECGYGEAR